MKFRAILLLVSGVTLFGVIDRRREVSGRRLFRRPSGLGPVRFRRADCSPSGEKIHMAEPVRERIILAPGRTSVVAAARKRVGHPRARTDAACGLHGHQLCLPTPRGSAVSTIARREDLLSHLGRCGVRLRGSSDDRQAGLGDHCLGGRVSTRDGFVLRPLSGAYTSREPWRRPGGDAPVDHSSGARSHHTAAADSGWRPVAGPDWLLLILSGVLFGMGQHLLIRAFSIAPAAKLTPLTYAGLLSHCLRRRRVRRPT